MPQATSGATSHLQSLDPEPAMTKRDTARFPANTLPCSAQVLVVTEDEILKRPQAQHLHSSSSHEHSAQKKMLTEAFATQRATNTPHSLYLLPSPPLGLCPQLQIALEMFISVAYLGPAAAAGAIWLTSPGEPEAAPCRNKWGQAVSRQTPIAGCPSRPGT